MNLYYRQPNYFGEFRCIGSGCPDNCCYNWRIDWKKEEIDKLKTAKNCSPELRELIEKAFAPNEDENLEGWYQVAFNEQRRCPLVTADGLCRIQKELGVEYMSNTCMIYPRTYFAAEPVIYRSCYSSCREIMRHLINDEKSMELINVGVRHKETVNAQQYTEENIAAHPVLKYRGELLEFFYEIIADKKHDVETNIILGALAAQALTKLVDKGDADKIPETLKQLRSQMHNGAQLRSIENIKPNYYLRFGVIGKILSQITEYSMISTLNDQTGIPNIDLYDTAAERLNEIFKDRPFYLRNIALNLLIELGIPLHFAKKTIFENYSLFAVVIACIKLNMIALAVTGRGEVNMNLYGRPLHYDGEDKFVGLTAIICRSLCQSPEKQEAVLKLLEEHKFTSPAYIALLVK